MSVVIQDVTTNRYVRLYDPESAHGRGYVEWTRQIDKAMMFATVNDAHEYRRAVPMNRPIGDDGEPNRPLMEVRCIYEIID